MAGVSLAYVSKPLITVTDSYCMQEKKVYAVSQGTSFLPTSLANVLLLIFSGGKVSHFFFICLEYFSSHHPSLQERISTFNFQGNDKRRLNYRKS